MKRLKIIIQEYASLLFFLICPLLVRGADCGEIWISKQYIDTLQMGQYSLILSHPIPCSISKQYISDGLSYTLTGSNNERIIAFYGVNTIIMDYFPNNIYQDKIIDKTLYTRKASETHFNNTLFFRIDYYMPVNFTIGYYNIPQTTLELYEDSFDSIKFVKTVELRKSSVN